MILLHHHLYLQYQFLLNFLEEDLLEEYFLLHPLMDLMNLLHLLIHRLLLLL
jgi:hypothetical protein